MKSVAEIAIVALIGTFTLIAGIIIPPAIIKTTVDKETILAYKFEKAQYGLLSLLSSTQDGKSVYELMGEKILLKDSVDITRSQNNFEKMVGTNYCILINPEVKGVVGTQEDILDAKICEVDAIFNTVIVKPYNKDSLVDVIGIGVK